jgi:hypothetical protein
MVRRRDQLTVRSLATTSRVEPFGHVVETIRSQSSRTSCLATRPALSIGPAPSPFDYHSVGIAPLWTFRLVLIGAGLAPRGHNAEDEAEALIAFRSCSREAHRSTRGSDDLALCGEVGTGKGLTLRPGREQRFPLSGLRSLLLASLQPLLLRTPPGPWRWF